MTTDTERERLRLDTGHSVTSLDNTEADAIFVRAAEEYSATAMQAGARVLAIQYLLADASKLNDYTQNMTTESASQIFGHLRKLLDYWQDVAKDDDAATRSKARFGQTKGKPTRIKGFPGR